MKVRHIMYGHRAANTREASQAPGRIAECRNRVSEPGGALAGARALAAEIAANGPFAVAMTNRVIDEAPAWPAAEVWPRQKEILERVIASNDAREGALAFAEKRKPVWSGS